MSRCRNKKKHSNGISLIFFLARSLSLSKSKNASPFFFSNVEYTIFAGAFVPWYWLAPYTTRESSSLSIFLLPSLARLYELGLMVVMWKEWGERGVFVVCLSRSDRFFKLNCNRSFLSFFKNYFMNFWWFSRYWEINSTKKD